MGESSLVRDDSEGPLNDAALAPVLLGTLPT